MSKTLKTFAASLIVAILLTGSTSADIVTDWNRIAEAVIRATPPPSRPLQVRALAIVNAAIYDAVNGIARKYEPYRITESAPPSARQEAAAAAAAYTVLKSLAPAQSVFLQEKFANSLSLIPGHKGQSQSITRGLEWGEQVAEGILAWRAHDNLIPALTYFGGNAPGQWRSIPNGGASGSIPQFAIVVPFAMNSSSQFRPGPPPSLPSAAYGADLNEVKELGRSDSQSRTPLQTELALLWESIGPLEENAIARSLVPAHYHLVDTARLLALYNFAACDAMIAGFDAKYHYGFWRPFHAIRLADTDGNPDTVADPIWTSLLAAPNHPDYISTHSVVTAASMRVLAHLLGDDTPFTLSSAALPGVAIRYNTFSEAIVEVSLSRVWGGIHFRTACQVGVEVGLAIGDHTITHALLPR